ncbi:hypothetical protein [Rhizobium wenxiniae]|uniref:hypothetical protein n=1 Tax=Rhizobium wenxiniae TaxID=1737357 RepID=UPI003C1F6164
MQDLISASDLTVMEDEPRIRDTDLAERLGFAAPRQVRELIERNRDELEAYGSLSYRTTNPGKLGGRPGKAYYLNEGQALVICALSRTHKAAQVRKMLIDVFMAYRQGKLVHVQEHHRRKPSQRKAMQFSYEENLSLIRAHEDHDFLLSGLMTRIQHLEMEVFGEHKHARLIRAR